MIYARYIPENILLNNLPYTFIYVLFEGVSGEIAKWIRPGDKYTRIDPATPPHLLTKVGQRQDTRQARWLD